MKKSFPLLKNIKHINLRDIIPLIAGLICILAFAPFNFYPLAVVSLIALLLSWNNVSKGRAFWRGLLYGIGLSSGGVYWLYISIHQFSDAPAIAALALTLLVILYLALFPAFVGYLLIRFFHGCRFMHYLCAFPALFSILEWTRSWAFTGFPWLSLGYSLTSSPFKFLAQYGGVYMLTFFIAQVSGSLVYAFYSKSKARYGVIAYLIIISAAIVCLRFHTFTQPSGKETTVNLIQGNISQSLKWDPKQARETLGRYEEMSKDYQNSLIIWPEAAIPLPLDRAQSFLAKQTETLNKNNSGLITGIPIASAEGTSFYNGAIALGNAHGDYYKRHLVPFGEYFPAPKLTRMVLAWFKVPMSDFSVGENFQKNITYKNLKIATFICYEIVFPEEVSRLYNEANVILALSDDAWFGHSTAQAQQLQMTQMRAIEMGRYVISATNNGLTAVINPQGVITGQAAAYTQAALTAHVTPMEGETFWIKHRMDPALLLWFALLIFSGFISKRCRENNQ